MSYQPVFPSVFTMYCDKASDCGGGESGITDMRSVTSELRKDYPEIYEKLRSHGIRYVFSMSGDYETGAYYNWKEQIAPEKEACEAFFREKGYAYEWSGEKGEDLSSWYSLPAFMVHHTTGEVVYFNQFTALHESYFFYHPTWTRTDGRNARDVAVPFGGADGSSTGKDGEKFPWKNTMNHASPALPPFTVQYGNGSAVPQGDIDILR